MKPLDILHSYRTQSNADVDHMAREFSRQLSSMNDDEKGELCFFILTELMQLGERVDQIGGINAASAPI